MASHDPKREKQWLEQQAMKVMKTAVNLKFKQNSFLNSEIKKTTETFVEANQYDQNWGVGLPISDKRVLNPAEWRGSNRLGEILTEVRAELKK